MNYKIVFGIILIFLLSNVFATHCIYMEGASFNSPTVSWNENVVNLPQVTTIDGADVTKIILPGAQLNATGFGTYIARCNNGHGVTQKAYSVLEMDGSRVRTNVINNGSARQAWDFPYCVSTPDGFVDGSTYPGCGNMDSINFNFGTGEDYVNQIGPHTYVLYTDHIPTKGSYGVALREKRTETFFVGGVPSVLVFGPADNTISFFEKDGYYESDIVFTIFKDGFISVDINDYNIECVGEGVTCTVEDTQKGIRLNAENSKAIVFGTLRISKEHIPKNVSVKLNVDYSVVNIPSTSQYGGIKSTYSKPMVVNVGYLDKQDFQVQVVSELDSIECISADGLIGQTGPDVNPRVNLAFGGNTIGDIQNQISIDECDSSNTNWVYCSQGEFIVTIARKIAEIAQLKDSLTADMSNEQIQVIEDEIAELSSFEINTRNLAIDNASLNESISYISGKIGFSTDIGLNYSGAGSFGEGQTIITSLRSMFTGNNKVEFTNQNGVIATQKIPAGTYKGKISFEGNPSSYYLFTDAIFNDEIKVTVDLSDGINPVYNWFFYEEGVEEIFDSVTTQIQSIEQTNILGRGILFSFNQNTDTTAKLFVQHAYPFFIKVEEVGSRVTNDYILDTIDPTPLLGNEGVFTYWNGFATNKSEGCEDISLANTDGILPYNLPDTLIDFDATNSKQSVSIEEYDLVKAGGIGYLQTVLYLPYNSSTASIPQLRIDGNFLLYSVANSCTTRPCNLTIIPNTNPMKIDNIKKLFDGINNRLVCVNERNTGNNTTWTLFWNEKRVLSALNDKKESIITDTIKICKEDELDDGFTPEIDDDPIPQEPEITCFNQATSTPRSLNDTLGTSSSELISYWAFNNSDLINNQINDLKGENNAEGENISLSPGKFGQGYSNSTNNLEVLNKENFDFEENNKISITAWVYHTGEEFTIIEKVKEKDCSGSTCEPPNSNFLLSITSDSKVRFNNHNSKWFSSHPWQPSGTYRATWVTHNNNYTTSNTLIQNSWNHIALTYDYSNCSSMNVYINGIKSSGNWKVESFPDISSCGGCSSYGCANNTTQWIGTTVEATAPNNAPVIIQNSNENILDEVSIWRKELSECEIKQLAFGPNACLPNC